MSSHSNISLSLSFYTLSISLSLNYLLSKSIFNNSLSYLLVSISISSNNLYISILFFLYSKERFTNSVNITFCSLIYCQYFESDVGNFISFNILTSISVLVLNICTVLYVFNKDSFI